MEKFGWKRIAALTEDGMKYTQYITDMGKKMEEKSLKLIINRKFSRTSDKDRQFEDFRTVSYLLDFHFLFSHFVFFSSISQS
jgi:hypothetical protein